MPSEKIDPFEGAIQATGVARPFGEGERASIPRISEIIARGEGGGFVGLMKRFQEAVADLPKEEMVIPVPRETKIARIADHMRSILEIIGIADRPGLEDTPVRYARMLVDDFTRGIDFDPEALLSVTFPESHSEMIVVKGIPFYSLCEHHLVPFYGVAHVGYIPSGMVLGLSKIPRLVDSIARQPTIQERITTEVADSLEGWLSADGVMVILEAEHLCMSSRGIQSQGAKTVTSAVRGTFKDSDAARAEFLSLIRAGG